MRDTDRNEPDVEGPENDRFDEGLARAARALYHEPPETPREDMWAVIQAARAADGRVPAGEDGVTPIRGFRPQPWWAAVAAALLIGVVLGRGSFDVGPEPAATVTEADAGAQPSAAGDRGGKGAEGGSSTATFVPRSYRVAAARHLTRTENFLTMFQVDARSEQVDSELGTWARKLLTDTRLLLDSPAGADPELRMLLGDLELVLAQIVQLRRDDPEEVDIIDEGLQSSQLLFRLRAATDAAAPGTVGLSEANGEETNHVEEDDDVGGGLALPRGPAVARSGSRAEPK